MSFGVQSASLFGSTTSTNSTSTSNSLRLFSDLDLTEDQRTKIRAIFQTAKSQGLSQSDIQTQINAVLTPDQLTTFENDIAAETASSTASSDATQKPQGPPPPKDGNPFADPNGPFANLNLTSDQQTQIAQIFADAKSQGLSFDQINAKIGAILTTAQQSTFATDLKNLPPPSADSSDASTASAGVSGQSQSGSDGTSASSSSITESSIQKQIAAAESLVLQQLQYDLTTSTT
jgi:Spy/CpxP family protein refolding chaperone